jgi:RNA polymerase sigma factor (sigma-70 family)
MTITIETGRSVTELVEAARERDLPAYEELVSRYENFVWYIVRGYRLCDADAHDAVQSTWLRLVENLDRLRDPERLGSWLATTAGRECLKLLRRNRNEVDGQDWFDQRPDDTSPTPEEYVVDDWMATALWQQVASLPGRGQTLVVALMASDPPAYTELAERAGMPIGSIGPTRARYLQRLRSALEGAGLGVDTWR